jgi:ring-1,2-phenylacetyl-CoA epoxidase subunit PaaE
MTGRIDAEKLATIFSAVLRTDDVDEWFLCGPYELVQLCRDASAARGVPAEKVRYELFTTGDPQGPEGNIGRPVLVDESAQSVQITFTLDGLQGTVATPVHAQESILKAALRVRSDVPFACASGVCGTCRAKLICGTVAIVENYALERNDIEKGFVLTCQSHPTSDSATVDYDASLGVANYRALRQRARLSTSGGPHVHQVPHRLWDKHAPAG